MKKTFTLLCMTLVSLTTMAQSVWTVKTSDKSYSFPIEEVTSVSFTNEDPWVPEVVKDTVETIPSLKSFQDQLTWTKEAVEKGYSAYPTKVVDVNFAPGQFVNTLPAGLSGTILSDLVKEYNSANGKNIKSVPSYATADPGFIDFIHQKYSNDSIKKLTIEAAQAVLCKGDKIGSYVTLGGWGGSVTVGFDHSIMNFEGADFRGYGNAFKGSSEPGVYYVAQKDSLGNPGKWYIIKHSMYDYAIHDYEVTYYKPEYEQAKAYKITYNSQWAYEYNRGYLMNVPYPRSSYVYDMNDTTEVKYVGDKLYYNDKNIWYPVDSTQTSDSYTKVYYIGTTSKSIDFKELNDNENHKVVDGKDYVEMSGEWTEVISKEPWHYYTYVDVNEAKADTVNKKIVIDDYTYELVSWECKTATKTLEEDSFSKQVIGGIYHVDEKRYDVISAVETAVGSFSKYIRWIDNKGHEGWLPKNQFHAQTYYPLYEGDSYTIKGEYLPMATTDTSGNGTYFVNDPSCWGFPKEGGKTVGAYGFCDEYPNNDDWACIDIDWAVDEDGNPANLDHIDFVKCQTGCNFVAGALGENSTEFCGVEDLHIKLQMLKVDTSIKPNTDSVSLIYDKFGK